MTETNNITHGNETTLKMNEVLFLSSIRKLNKKQNTFLYWLMKSVSDGDITIAETDIDLIVFEIKALA